ncbi:helix-turn-helix transcriptional regulator [Salsipaludibacter albus]|uniref:helix-turn-helix transcriptional regulator n=1 Tax=Salsipaludibacter albus TaxID=2849650 RepID=UPI001EE4AEBB|nr:HTH domain-containing protein [Salsipaludibacter albus]MBY5162490.1 HTH domain-containing protein [Salsipaludibacter albus]
MDPLHELGASGPATRVYSHLMAHRATSEGRLASDLDISADEVKTAVEDLESLGLLVWVDGRMVAVTPRTPLERYARARAREADLARTAAEQLGQLWSLHQGRADYLEIVPTMEAARRIQARVLADSRDQVRALSIGSSTERLRIAEGLFETLDRGTTVRSIYGAEVLRNPGALAMVQDCILHGEQARVFPGVPMNLLISDDLFALVVVRVASSRLADGVIIHASDFLDTMVGVFEAFWRLAVPVSGSTTAAHIDKESTETRRLLTNLAAGLTDKAIARDLEVSERTVRRRISQLQELLGAQTRFQLGVQASRHGWL